MKTIYNKIVLVTGGCGSIGSEIVKKALKYGAKQVRVYDNRESELFHLQHQLSEFDNLRTLLGDIRDKKRLLLALENVDIVFHAAALKHVPSCEFNPFEAVKTNVQGTQNLIDACLERGVERVVNISTDKVTNSNTMGATKLLAEKLIGSAQYYKGDKKTIFTSVRFGNVIGSNGSVLDLFKKQLERNDPLTVTDLEMKRFIMSIPDAVNLVFKASESAQGGEVFILKMPVMRLKELVEVFKEHYNKEKHPVKIIGMRPGERMYEELMTAEEAENSLETDTHFIVQSQTNIPYWKRNLEEYEGARKTDLNKYSVNDSRLMSKEELREFLLSKNIL